MTEKPKSDPTIISISQNVTTKVGLPVTLTCHIEGDLSHYWVRWMSRNAIVQEEEKHSISSSPSFNGTVHYLTVHSVKVSREYSCKVCTINNEVVDEVTHQIHVDNGMIKQYHYYTYI